MLPLEQTNFYILTGGPGSGKTTLLEALAKHGHAVMPEAGRSIIKSQTAVGGRALPWADRNLYSELMLCWELRSFAEAGNLDGIVFFDRGVPDVIGYLNVCRLPVPPHFCKAAELFRYNAKVFIAPPWPEIFGQDAERKQDWSEAKATCQAMRRVYQDFGYELLDLPLVSIEERVDFVLRQIHG